MIIFSVYSDIFSKNHRLPFTDSQEATRFLLSILDIASFCSGKWHSHPSHP